jgi:hypothetical protein
MPAAAAVGRRALDGRACGLNETTLEVGRCTNLVGGYNITWYAAPGASLLRALGLKSADHHLAASLWGLIDGLGSSRPISNRPSALAVRA